MRPVMARGQIPHFTTDLARYDRELELALAVIAAENPGSAVLVCGHSAGGLIVSLWLDRLRRRGATAALGVTGLMLNSPWFDLRGPAILRTGDLDRHRGDVAGSARPGWCAAPERAATG